MKTTGSKNEAELLELITRRQKQLIVHSFLYYVLNESVIDDHTFDLWCKELVELQTEYPQIAKKAPYWTIAKRFDETGSGFFIRKYPEKLQLDAYFLLDAYRKRKGESL